MDGCGLECSKSHLWSAWVLGVIEIFTIDSEKGIIVRCRCREIPEVQCLEVVNLLHQPYSKLMTISG